MILSLRIIKSNPWTGFTKWKNASDHICAEMSRSGSLKTGLTPEDEDRLEKLLGYEKGTLLKNSKFWHTYFIKIPGNGTIIDTEDPYGELSYKVLSAHSHVAPNLASITPQHDWVFVHEEAEATEKNRLDRIRRKALAEFEKLSLDEMRKCLRLYGYMSDSLSAELVERRLVDEIEKDPQKFFDKWVNNKRKETEYLLQLAVARGVIRKNKTIYTFGTDVIGETRELAINYLDAKTNTDIRIAIQQEVDAKVSFDPLN